MIKYKGYINTVVMVLILIVFCLYNNHQSTKSEVTTNDKISEMTNKILLRMNKHALSIQGVQRIIDSSRKIDSELSYMYAEEIVNTANRYETISIPLLASIFYNESRFGAHRESPAGAEGMGQLMPTTAYWIAREWNLVYTDTLVYDYKFNIRATAWYLDFLYKVPKNSKGDLERTVAWYNGGGRQAYRWGLYRKHMDGITLDSLETELMNRLADETKNYVHNVMKQDSVFRESINNEIPLG